MVGKDVGIDLGTATVLVYVKGKGIVVNEPSVVALDKNTMRLRKVGREAREMLGRTPENIIALRPLRDGVISKYDITQQMIQYFINKACGPQIFKPRMVICIPSGVTEVEKRAVLDAATQAGSRKTYLVEEPVAAAMGAGLDITLPTGNMIVDIGGGTTDIAVISLNYVVVSDSIKVAGDKFDEAIIRYVRKKHKLLIGETTAELIKRRIGTVWEVDDTKYIDVKGRCLVSGLPRVIRIHSREMLEALEEPISFIIESIRGVVERTPPELVGDILNNGIILTGGGCLLAGLDKLIAYVTGIKTVIAKNPERCVALGTGKCLDNLAAMPEVQLSDF